jgi:hypothetical protein
VFFFAFENVRIAITVCSPQKILFKFTRTY